MSKVEIETDCAEFLASIERWDGSRPAFRQVVASAIFHAFRCFKAEEFRAGITSEYAMMGSSLSRYASGVSEPHPAVQASVVHRIAELIKELDERHRRENAHAIAFMRQMGDSPDD